MAEKPSELKIVEKQDGTSTATNTGEGGSIEKYAAGDFSDAERRDLRTDDGEAPVETEHIKAQIEETRSQMGETIDAIQERLSFANISEQVSETVSNAIETAKDTAYDATIGKAVNFMKNVGDGVAHSGTFKTVKKNPFPFALIGLGTGLLVYQSMNWKSSSRRGNGRASGRGFYEDNTPARNDEVSAFRSAKRSVGDVSGRAYDGISDKASSAYETVSKTAGSAYDSVTGAVNSAYTGAGEMANRAYDRAGEYGNLAYEKYDETLEEHPLALGAIALAVGAAVGFAIPSTNYEGRVMGEARENLVQRTQDAAGSLVDKAKQVANEAGQTIEDETQAALGH